jgi:hypothetical protein
MKKYKIVEAEAVKRCVHKTNLVTLVRHYKNEFTIGIIQDHYK